MIQCLMPSLLLDESKNKQPLTTLFPFPSLWGSCHLRKEQSWGFLQSLLPSCSALQAHSPWKLLFSLPYPRASQELSFLTVVLIALSLLPCRSEETCRNTSTDSYFKPEALWSLWHRDEKVKLGEWEAEVGKMAVAFIFGKLPLLAVPQSTAKCAS